jgi:hypothetical protein
MEINKYKKIIMITGQEQLNYINKECNTNYTSLDKVDWYVISTFRKLSESFIREFKNKVDWLSISAYQKLSESFIKEFQDKVNWDCISHYPNLSTDFIREFQAKLDWEYISQYYNLSKEFLREFKDRIHRNNFFCREDIRDILIDKMIN